jgi:Uma2 family endonuclease
MPRWCAWSAGRRSRLSNAARSPPLCPDLVIELASASDSGPRGADALRRKMALYQANGSQLGWLLFPEQRAVEIWPARPEAGAAAAPQRLENALRLDGGSVLPGFVLELQEIWEPS